MVIGNHRCGLTVAATLRPAIPMRSHLSLKQSRRDHFGLVLFPYEPNKSQLLMCKKGGRGNNWAVGCTTTPKQPLQFPQPAFVDACLEAKSEIETDRNLGNFSPCIWGDHFASLSLDDSVSEAYANEIEGLKAQVSGMVMDDSMDFKEKISLINTLHRLGISYLFDKEICGRLENYFTSLNLNSYEKYDLHTISVHFQVFRLHGHKMPCDVFHKFTDEMGRFKESVANDVMGMLSLYEASQLRVRGEDVLDEAETFSKTQLEQYVAADDQLESSHNLIAKRIRRALEQSCYKGIPRMEARVYISFYEDDKSHNELILRLAKLDFNLLQSLYQKELSILSRWSKEKKFPSKSSYTRDRVVESHLFAVAYCFESQYSLARIIVSKIVIIGTLIDDAYDSFGKYEELELFTDAINRWDINPIDELPDYMKFVYSELLSLYDEFYEQANTIGRSYGVDYSKEAFQSLCRAYLKIAEWFNNKHIPSFDEYIKTAYHSTAFYLCTVSTFIGMFDCANEETFGWIKGQPKILKAVEAISRLQNDIVDREFDQRAGRAASGIECYKEDHCVSESEVIEAIEGMIGNAWKDLYEEFLTLSVVPLRIRRMFVDFSGSVDVMYKYVDGFVKPEWLKGINTLLFVDPVPL